MRPRIHLIHDDAQSFTLCGRGAFSFHATIHVDGVTCRACLRVEIALTKARTARVERRLDELGKRDAKPRTGAR